MVSKYYCFYACTFEGTERSTHDLKQLFLHTLLEWTNALGVLALEVKNPFLEQLSFLGQQHWRILTIDNPHSRRIQVLDQCYKCKCNGQIVDHLLLHCPIATELWSMEFGLFGVYWVMSKTVVDLFTSWQGQLGCHRHGIV